MKTASGLLIFFFLTVSLFSVTVDEILRSKDVLAYSSGYWLYLMDLVTFNEIRIDEKSIDFAWDKTGQKLYTVTFVSDDENNAISLDLYVFNFPSPKKVKLTNIPLPKFRGEDEHMNCWLFLNKDATLTIESVYGALNEKRWLIIYNPVTNKIAPAVEGAFHPATDSWLPTGTKRITTEGYGIINRPTVGFNELYLNQAKAGESENYVKLTNFHNLMSEDPTYIDYSELIQFTTSQDGSLILFGSIDKYDGFGLRPGAICAVNSDGTNEQILNKNLFMDQTTNYGWLSDGRLFYTGFAADSMYDMTICLLDKQGKITTARTFVDGEEISRALYRYKSK